jgi:hypothetical protein
VAVSVKQFIGSEYVTHIEQIHPPQPAESPDDWVTQDRETIRPALDQFRWVGSSTLEWFLAYDFPAIAGRRHGDKGSMRSVHDTFEVRCRRKDLPKVESPDDWVTQDLECYLATALIIGVGFD